MTRIPTLATATRIAPDGQIVTVTDRAPRKGERGMWIDPTEQTSMEEALDYVITEQTAPGEYGWEAYGDEAYVEDGLHTVTVSFKRGRVPIDFSAEELRTVLAALPTGDLARRMKESLAFLEPDDA